MACTKYEDKGVIEVSFLMWKPSNHRNTFLTIGTRNVVDAYHPKESPYQILTQYDLKQRSY